MFILDTDLLTLLQFGAGTSFQRLRERMEESRQPIVATVVSIEEHMRGWLGWINKHKEMDRLIEGYRRLREAVAFYQRHPVLDFDDKAAVVCQRLGKLKTRVGTLDLRIASIAMANDATLLSRNLVDFMRIPGLRVEDWSA